MSNLAASEQSVTVRTMEVAKSREAMLEAKKRLIAANNQIDALESEYRVTAATRRAGEEAVYRDIDQTFKQDGKTGPTIH